jgi:hypothetical protein
MGSRTIKPYLIVGVLSLAAVTFCGLQHSHAKEKWAKNLPTEKAFRKSLLKIMKSYPTNGKHQYYWPRGGGKGWKGTTCDLVYRGETIAKGDENGRCFCCGLTFEVFFRAYEECLKTKKKEFQIGDLNPKGVKKLISAWFGSKSNRFCSGTAIPNFNLGRAIPKLKNAKSGDFVQFWRHSGSGHSVVFVGWVKDKQGKITGLRYWSTQKSTKGIGQRTEHIGAKGIKRDEIYIARVGRS